MSSPAAIPFNHSIPLYHQIALTLRGRADAGGLGAGGGQATEHQLCAEFGVSRSTIRQALEMLKRDGLLESRRGVGTRPMARSPVQRLTSSAGDPLHAGLGTFVRLISKEQVEPPPEVKAFLQADRGVTRLVRLHTLEGTPLSVVVSYLPTQYTAGITARTLRKSVHELLWLNHGLVQKRSVHRIGVARADTMVAPLLGVGIADPVLHVQSSAFLEDGRPIRWTNNYFREERFAYQVEVDWKKPSAGAAGRKGAEK